MIIMKTTEHAGVVVSYFSANFGGPPPHNTIAVKFSGHPLKFCHTILNKCYQVCNSEAMRKCAVSRLNISLDPNSGLSRLRCSFCWFRLICFWPLFSIQNCGRVFRVGCKAHQVKFFQPHLRFCVVKLHQHFTIVMPTKPFNVRTFIRVLVPRT